MSYDLIFVPRADDQSWDDALDAAEENDTEGSASPEVWARLLARASQILGAVTVSESAEYTELDHEPTGVQISYYGDEATITVPYWYRGQEARALVEKIYLLAEVVTEETGLPGYDPQLEMPVPEAARQVDQAVAVFDTVAASFAERGIASPSGG